MDNRDDQPCRGCYVALSRGTRCARCQRVFYSQLWLWGMLVVGLGMLIFERWAR